MSLSIQLGVRIFVIAIIVFSFSSQVFAETKPAEDPTANSVDTAVNDAANRSSVLTSFVGSNRGELIASYDEQRDQHLILFYMGVALLIFVFLTAGFGIAMGMLGKEVFIQHMVCAGITVFLATAHAVVAMVWFFPF